MSQPVGQSFYSLIPLIPRKKRDGNKKERKTQNLHKGETEEKLVFVLYGSWSFHGNRIKPSSADW